MNSNRLITIKVIISFNDLSLTSFTSLKNLRWNFEKHVIQIPKYRNKSRFFVTTEKELEQLVEAATHISGYIQKTSGNYIRTVNAGKIIGFDVTTNSTTTIYTVVTNPKTNELISIFPGLPK